MKKEEDFFERCIGIVAGLEVENEAQAIAKEVVLDEVEKLQQRIAMAQDYIRNESYLSDSEIDEVARILEGDYDAEEVEE